MIERCIAFYAVADVVKDKEFKLRAKDYSIANACRGKVSLGSFCCGPWIPLITGGAGFVNVAEDNKLGLSGKRIHDCRLGIRHQDHVGFIEPNGVEAEFIEPVLQRAGAPLVLVGHSYGAAVALIAALRQPARVKALVLYEPTLFSLVDAESPPPNAADGIRQAVAAAAAALGRGDANGAAEHFIDYWMGAGSWAGMPASRQAPIAASVRNVRRWAHALTTEPAPLAAWRALDMPVLYMLGGRSTASAHGVARLLAPALPHATQHRFEALGHMGPVTDPEPVNRAIEDFIARL